MSDGAGADTRPFWKAPIECKHKVWNNRVGEPMDVVGFGRAMNFSNVPAGGLFLASKQGKPHVCIRLDAPADACAVLVYPEGASGESYMGQPGVAMFSA